MQDDQPAALLEIRQTLEGVLVETSEGDGDSFRAVSKPFDALIRPHTLATKDTYVIAGNQLARAHQESPRDLHDTRLTLLAIAKVDRNADLLNDVCISMEEIRDIFPQYKGRENVYSIIKATTKPMLGTHVLIEYKKGEFRRINLFNEVSYKRGVLTISFNEKVRDMLLLLTTNFTRYQLNAISRLDSVYHVLLFNVLRSYSYKGKVSLTPSQIKSHLGIPQDNYPLPRKLLSVVLEPACAAITNHSDILVSIKPVRVGRNIDHFDFTISLKTASAFTVFEEVAMAMLRERKVSAAAAADAVRQTGASSVVTKIAILEHRESMTHLKKLDSASSYLAEMLKSEPVIDPEDQELQRRIRGKHQAYRQAVFAKLDQETQQAHYRLFARDLKPEAKLLFDRFKTPDATPMLRQAFAIYLNKCLNPEEMSIKIERS